MYLKCSVCEEIQPVTKADPEDEDLRTQGIRKTFRADHLASCGPNTVSLVIGELGPVVDKALWQKYLTHVNPPSDATLDPVTGAFSRDGWRLCEDCWNPIPPYIDFPVGLTSPESDGDAAGNFAKIRSSSVEGKGGIEHLRKCVCLPCYFEAFKRFYPGAPLPNLSATVPSNYPTQSPIEHTEFVENFVPDPLGPSFEFVEEKI